MLAVYVKLLVSWRLPHTGELVVHNDAATACENYKVYVSNFGTV